MTATSPLCSEPLEGRGLNKPKRSNLAHQFSLAFAAVALSVGVAGEAAGDAGPPINPGWYAPVGVVLGGAFRPIDANGFLAGMEVSGARLSRNLFWGGLYTDVLYDTGKKGARFSLGPELGFAMLGLDGGFMGEFSDHKFKKGVVLRGLLTFSIMAFYGRWGHFINESDSNWGEFGVLFKLPLPISVETTRRGGPRYYPEHELPNRRDSAPDASSRRATEPAPTQASPSTSSHWAEPPP